MSGQRPELPKLQIQQPYKSRFYRLTEKPLSITLQENVKKSTILIDFLNELDEIPTQNVQYSKERIPVKEGANIHSDIKNPPDAASQMELHEDTELKLVPGQGQEINGRRSSIECVEPFLQTPFQPPFQTPTATAVTVESAKVNDDEGDYANNETDEICLLEFETKEPAADSVAVKKIVSNYDAERSVANSTPIFSRLFLKSKIRQDFGKNETLEPAHMEIGECDTRSLEPSTSQIENQKPAVLPVTPKQVVPSLTEPIHNQFEFEINDNDNFCFESWFRGPKKDKVVNKEPDKQGKKSVVNEKEVAKKGKKREIKEKIAVQPRLNPTRKPEASEIELPVQRDQYSGSKKRKPSEDNKRGETQKTPGSRQLKEKKSDGQQEAGSEPLPRSKRLLTPIRTTKMGVRDRTGQGKKSAVGMTKLVEEEEELWEEPSLCVEKLNLANTSKETLKRMPATRNFPKGIAYSGKKSDRVSGDCGPNKSIPSAEISESGSDDGKDRDVELEKQQKKLISGKSSSPLSRCPQTIQSKRTSTPIPNKFAYEMEEDTESSCTERSIRRKRKDKVVNGKPNKQRKKSIVIGKFGKLPKRGKKSAVAMTEIEKEKMQEEPCVYVKEVANQTKKSHVSPFKKPPASRGSVNCPTRKSKERSGRDPSAETKTLNRKSSAKMKQQNAKNAERTRPGCSGKQTVQKDDLHSENYLQSNSEESYTKSGRRSRPPNQWWKIEQQEYSPPVCSQREVKSAHRYSLLPPSQNKIKHRVEKSSAQQTKKSARIKSVVPQQFSSDENEDFIEDDDDSTSGSYSGQLQPAVLGNRPDQCANRSRSEALTKHSGKYHFKSPVPQKHVFPDLADGQENPSALHSPTKRPRLSPHSTAVLNQYCIEQLKEFSTFRKPIAVSRQARDFLLSSASKPMSTKPFQDFPVASSTPDPRYMSIPVSDSIYCSKSKRWLSKNTLAKGEQQNSPSLTETGQNLSGTRVNGGEPGLIPGIQNKAVELKKMNFFTLNRSGPGPANQPLYSRGDSHEVMSGGNDEDQTSGRNENSLQQLTLIWSIEENCEILQNCVGISGSRDLEYPLKLDCGEDDTSLGICRELDHETFACGKLFLGPCKEKGVHQGCRDTMLFHIIHGHVKASINNSLYDLKQGDCFCVPPGNPYNITNSLNLPAILFYTQLKQPDNVN